MTCSNCGAPLSDPKHVDSKCFYCKRILPRALSLDYYNREMAEIMGCDPNALDDDERMVREGTSEDNLLRLARSL